MKLTNLPLRPTSLALLSKRGFQSSQDVQEALQLGGMSNLAMELDCSLTEASSLQREVESALHAIQANSSYNTQDTATTSHEGNSTKPNHPIRNSDCMGTATTLSAADVLRLQNNTTSKTNTNGSLSAALLARPIVTFCRSIDNLLGGGIPTGEVTEIAGIPGAGKTQLAMQLCVNARIPREYGGVAGQAVYIDTEGSFSPERCGIMAEALVEHVRGMASSRARSSGSGSQKRGKMQLPEWFCPEEILDGIHVYRVHDETSQMATIYNLPSFLDQMRSVNQDKGQDGGGVCPVKLVVIDSIAFHCRSSTNFKARTRSLTTMAAFLSDLSTTYQLAVVVVNQMTTKVAASASSSSLVTPALGESWAHATTTRLILSSTSSSSTAMGAGSVIRTCALVKSPHKPEGEAKFVVTEVGVRDVPKQTSSSSSRGGASNRQHGGGQKRNMIQVEQDSECSSSRRRMHPS